jgi:predicted adenine nucleotide alpha hydrolase (AANH) superfamily ATPase
MSSLAPSRLLLHVCCGPCAIAPVEWLQVQGVEVVGLYFNPNIHPLQEYLRRRQGLVEVAERMGFEALFLDEEYAPRDFFHAIHGRESERCPDCYSLRLDRVAALAAQGGFPAFTSTLLYSKYQKHEAIVAAGRPAAAAQGIDFFYHDFREGWRRGIDLSKEWGIYRQQYCGCLYSEFERYRREWEAVCASARSKPGTTTA